MLNCRDPLENSLWELDSLLKSDNIWSGLLNCCLFIFWFRWARRLILIIYFISIFILIVIANFLTIFVRVAPSWTFLMFYDKLWKLSVFILICWFIRNTDYLFLKRCNQCWRCNNRISLHKFHPHDLTWYSMLTSRATTLNKPRLRLMTISWLLSIWIRWLRFFVFISMHY